MQVSVSNWSSIVFAAAQYMCQGNCCHPPAARFEFHAHSLMQFYFLISCTRSELEIHISELLEGFISPVRKDSFPICFAVVGKMILWEGTVNVRLANFMSNAHKQNICKIRQKLVSFGRPVEIGLFSSSLGASYGMMRASYWIWYHSSWAETALFVGDGRLKEGHNWIITPPLSLFQHVLKDRIGRGFQKNWSE